MPPFVRQLGKSKTISVSMVNSEHKNWTTIISWVLLVTSIKDHEPNAMRLPVGWTALQVMLPKGLRKSVLYLISIVHSESELLARLYTVKCNGCRSLYNNKCSRRANRKASKAAAEQGTEFRSPRDNKQQVHDLTYSKSNSPMTVSSVLNCFAETNNLPVLGAKARPKKYKSGT